MLYDWLYSFHRCLLWRCLHWGITHSLMIDFVRWQFMPIIYFPEIILYWGFTHFEMMHSYWGIATLLILTLRLHILLWLLFLMDHNRVIDTMGSIFLTYLVRLGYPLSFVTHLYILYLTPLYLHPSYQSLTPFEPTYFIILHDLILFFWSEEDTD